MALHQVNSTSSQNARDSMNFVAAFVTDALAPLPLPYAMARQICDSTIGRSAAFGLDTYFYESDVSTKMLAPFKWAESG
jgi:hypothetical protein